MKYSLIFSILLHSLLLGSLFWQSSPSEKKIVRVTLVELLASQPLQRERREKIKSRKKLQPTIAVKKNRTAPHEKERPTQGLDSEDLSEIKAFGGGQSVAEVVSYGRELERYIAKNRYYPRRAMRREQTGTVKIRLIINPDGSFAKVEIIEGTKHGNLNRAAHDLVTRLKSFKPLPKSYRGSGEFVVPINYQLRNKDI